MVSADVNSRSQSYPPGVRHDLQQGFISDARFELHHGLTSVAPSDTRTVRFDLEPP